MSFDWSQGTSVIMDQFIHGLGVTPKLRHLEAELTAKLAFPDPSPAPRVWKR